MANETYVTIRGYAGADPVIFKNDDAPDVAQVSVGVTPSYFHRGEQQYREGPTVWYEVRARGALGHNLAASCRTGTPLLIRGRLGTREWSPANENGEKSGARTRLVIVADAVGVELAHGTASYVKVRRDGSEYNGGNYNGTAGDEPGAAGGEALAGGSGTGVPGNPVIVTQGPNPEPDEWEIQEADPAGNLQQVM
ncbi:single-strand DNA-binding protein [Actinobaculum suis]|uniref:Single-strand DNA-binding protein n=1 Tax=Actinobaculum suis TaxID=1657 RepID=A0A1G6ZNQ9_9ACTO|nr:single-stranded DNA-binding protein [Actinobaculum suis]MDY5153970.1 single-stranded DNA-binding protein [Actinobaculum suis]SDE04122.1 single-strand DNA-binding protein [Actinobaculum suis]